LIKIEHGQYGANKCSYLLGGDHMIMSIGQTIEIIYMDKVGKITQRKIEVNGIREGRIRATCLATSATRIFLVTSILAWQPVQEQRYA
jgi:hypothetical protein